MKTRVLVFLLVLALASVSGLGVASAQEGTRLKAVSDGTIDLYAAPDAGADVTKVISQRPLYIAATDVSGQWLEVTIGERSGWVMASDVTVLNLPLLAPKFYVATRTAGAAALFAKPDLASKFIASLPNGTVGTVLALKDQFAMVETPLGTGWSVVTSWDPMPEGAQLVSVSLARSDTLGVFADALLGSELIGALQQGEVVWQMGPVDGQWAPVMLADGTMGYVIAADLAPLPTTWAVEAEGGGQTQPALFDQPDFGGNVAAVLEVGTTFTYLGAEDDFWVKLYHPNYGIAYGLKKAFGNVYGVATVQQRNSIVREGPNDNLYNPVAIIPAGTQVIVKGVSESGAWVEVAIPLDLVTYGYRGVSGWMRDFLFADDLGNTDLDTSALAVTE